MTGDGCGEGWRWRCRVSMSWPRPEQEHSILTRSMAFTNISDHTSLRRMDHRQTSSFSSSSCPQGHVGMRYKESKLSCSVAPQRESRVVANILLPALLDRRRPSPQLNSTSMIREFASRCLLFCGRVFNFEERRKRQKRWRANICTQTGGIAVRQKSWVAFQRPEVFVSKHRLCVAVRDP